MKDQHTLITGYRDLTVDEIALINKVKAASVEVGELVRKLKGLNDAYLDPRWIAIGETHLQQGFMALARAIAKPETF